MICREIILSSNIRGVEHVADVTNLDSAIVDFDDKFLAVRQSRFNFI